MCFGFMGSRARVRARLRMRLSASSLRRAYVTKILDGDNIRSRLNAEHSPHRGSRSVVFGQLGSSSSHRSSHPSANCARKRERSSGHDDCTPVYIEASFETCAERDVKGLYAKAASGGVKNFTGKDSSFEMPETAQRLDDFDGSTNRYKSRCNAVLDRSPPHQSFNLEYL